MLPVWLQDLKGWISYRSLRLRHKGKWMEYWTSRNFNEGATFNPQPLGHCSVAEGIELLASSELQESA